MAIGDLSSEKRFDIVTVANDQWTITVHYYDTKTKTYAPSLTPVIPTYATQEK